MVDCWIYQNVMLFLHKGKDQLNLDINQKYQFCTNWRQTKYTMTKFPTPIEHDNYWSVVNINLIYLILHKVKKAIKYNTVLIFLFLHKNEC